MTALTRSLFAGAVLMTLADGIAYLVLIAPGRVAEMNELIVGLTPGSAAGVKLAEAVLIVAAALVAIAARRHVTAAVVLSLAIVAGLLGVVTTIGAAL